MGEIKFEMEITFRDLKFRIFACGVSTVKKKFLMFENHSGSNCIEDLIYMCHVKISGKESALFDIGGFINNAILTLM